MHELSTDLPEPWEADLSDAERSEKRLVPAVERAVAIMDLLAGTPRPMGVSDIARDLGLPKSSVYGICETLTELGLLRPGPSGYAPGPRPLRWSSAYLSRTSLVQEFRLLVAQDAVLSGYTVTLSTLDGANVVYLACQNADKPLGFTFQAGQHLPAVFTATGKAMLAALPDAERQDRLAGPWHPPFTRNGVPDAAAFEAQVPRWRALGYAIDNGEIREGMICLGAAILNTENKPHAGIAVSLTSTEARPEIRENLGNIIAKIARKLEGQ